MHFFDEIMEHLEEEDNHLTEDAECHPIAWKLPDLSEGGAWFWERMMKLTQVALEYGSLGPEMIEEGKKILDIHRRNYDSEGPKPKQLQLIWWA